MTEAPDDDPRAELERCRAALHALGLVPAAVKFADHAAEHGWWKDAVMRYAAADEGTDLARANECGHAVVNWHVAWLATQPQYPRTRAYELIGARLRLLAERVREPAAHPKREPINERQQLDRMITESTAIRDQLN